MSRATDYLFEVQRPDGGWTDRLSSSAIPTALGVLALARADRGRYADQIDTGLAWLREAQRLDGGWGLADSDPPGDASVTAFAVAALKVLDPLGSTRCIDDGMDFIAKNGGEEAVFPNIRTWRELVATVWALEGLRDIRQQPRQPLEVMLLPARLRNRASIALPGVIALGVGQARVMPAGVGRGFAERLATSRGLRWLRSVQAANGGIEECPLMAAIVFMGLRTASREVGEDIQRGCLDYLVQTQRPDGSWAIDRDLEIAVTAYAVLALAESCHAATEPRLRLTRDWLLSTQWREPFSAIGLPAGGWSWAAPSGWPESEDTAVVLSVLGLLGLPKADPAIQRGLRWLLDRQNGDGSWSEWVRDSSMVHDGPCTGVTSHVIMALHQFGVTGGRRSPIARALDYLRETQRPDGAAPSLWFRDSTHGTAKVLEAYAGLGLSDRPVATKARGWLLRHQRADGAWPAEVVEGAPDGGTAEETAWSVYSLLRAGESPRRREIERAVGWLVDQQNGTGTWRPSVVGLYYDQMYYSDDLIAHTYTLRALARWLSLTSSAH